MPQVTIYLDDDTEARLRAAALAEGIPVSRWISRLVRERTRTEWPPEVRALAGAWGDLPDGLADGVLSGTVPATGTGGADDAAAAAGGNPWELP